MPARRAARWIAAFSAGETRICSWALLGPWLMAGG